MYFAAELHFKFRSKVQMKWNYPALGTEQSAN